MLVLITDEAEVDLEQIGDRIFGDSPERAFAFVTELREACEGLGDMAKRFPLVPRYELSWNPPPGSRQLFDILPDR
jgi:toxin ParE1/3/4